MNQVDYLVIGHVCKDVIPGGYRVGGTAAYAGQTAQTLGCRTAVLTSVSPKFAAADHLPGLSLHIKSAAATTTFENRYGTNGRTQTIHSLAAPITAADLPPAWRRPAIVHFGPVADEIDPALINSFSNSLIGITPQGWLRKWDADGRVHTRQWESAPTILPLAAAVILSREDLVDEHMLADLCQWSRLLVLTENAKGCTLFWGDESRHVPAPQVAEVESTGAGDIFAAAFLIRLWQTAGNPIEAARFANEIAAQSVTQVGLKAKMEAITQSLQMNR